MTYTNFTLKTDDGIALVTWDMAGKSMNVIDMSVMDELDAIIDEIVADEAVTGAIITSGKPTFTGGADLTMLEGLLGEFHKTRSDDPEGAARMLFDGSRRLSLIYRKLETCGKPFVAALNGTTMGGGTELRLPVMHASPPRATPSRWRFPRSRSGCFPAPAAPSG